MRVLLTEHSAIGMKILSSLDNVIVDYYGIGKYYDPLFEVKDYINLCCNQEYNGAVMVCNKSPWSDWIWTSDNKDMYELKGQIFSLIGWKPDIIINIYKDRSLDTWRSLHSKLILDDPNINIIGLNTSDVNFEKNIIETITGLLPKPRGRSAHSI